MQKMLLSIKTAT